MTRDDIIRHGRNLFVAADNIRRASADLDALWESIMEALKGETFGQDEATKPKGRDDPYGTDWIYPIYARTFEVRKTARKGGARGKVVSTITIAIRLCGTADLDEPRLSRPWLNQAALIVACPDIGLHGRVHVPKRGKAALRDRAPACAFVMVELTGVPFLRTVRNGLSSHLDSFPPIAPKPRPRRVIHSPLLC